MKNKAPLLLIEIIVTVLVFAMAAAICLRGLVTADTASRANRERDLAGICLQNAAETVKAGRGEAPSTVWFTEDFEPAAENPAYTLSVEKLETGSPLLGEARLSITNADGALIAELTAAWQEDSDE